MIQHSILDYCSDDLSRVVSAYNYKEAVEDGTVKGQISMVLEALMNLDLPSDHDIANYIKQKHGLNLHISKVSARRNSLPGVKACGKKLHTLPNNRNVTVTTWRIN